jgi:hypothetical protein
MYVYICVCMSNKITAKTTVICTYVMYAEYVSAHLLAFTYTHC